MTLSRCVFLRFCVGCALFLSQPVFAADWPMFRFDAHHSAASPQQLSKKLYLQWVKTLPALKPAWPDQSMMPFDVAYEPIVVGQRLYYGSSHTDSIHALNTETGNEVWRYATEGPIRFAPVAWGGRLYFVSDDGYLYCIMADTGKLVWKYRGGPSDRKALGNERIISMWPARGAPVVADGTVYFAASIWPFMGIFIHALDAKTGQNIWTNDGDGSMYMKQPHQTDSFAGVAPQGPITVIGDKLLISGGRSIPACLDRKTGKLIHYLLADNSKKGGGSTVAAIGKIFWNGGWLFDVATGASLGSSVQSPVLTEDALYGYDVGGIRSYDLANAEMRGSRWTILDTGGFRMEPIATLIRAGNRLYAAAPNRVLSLGLPMAQSGSDRPEWEVELRGTPTTLVAADDKLFAVTLEGQIYCYGPCEVEPALLPHGTVPFAVDAWTKRAKAILDTTKVREGYCISWGVGSGRLIAETVRQSKLHVIAVEPNAEKAEHARARFIEAGLYGERVAVIHADPLKVELPPYVAALMISEDLSAAGLKADEESSRVIFHSLRPYGGVACLPIAHDYREPFAQVVKDAKLSNAEVHKTFAGTLLIRAGALPGAGNWTHEHADAANTRVSPDTLVKAPLGLLWFGGPPNDGILPRHGHGPQPQVVDGRLIIEGNDKLRCLDVYTGRLFWESPFYGLGGHYNNLAHQPGANASNTNYISNSDGIYVAYRDSCIVLDPETGKRIAEFKLPSFGDGRIQPRWGYINVAGDYLIGGAEPIFDANMLPLARPKLGIANLSRGENDNLSSSKYLFVMDRHTGKLLWHRTARYGFRHNAVCVAGTRLYCIDRLSGAQIKRLKKMDEGSDVIARLSAFDLEHGTEIWQTEDEVFGTCLSYSRKHDALVESGRNARDTLSDEPKGMRVFHGADGKVMWFEKSFFGPAMLHGDDIIRDKGASDILTGKPKMRLDPLTEEMVEWDYLRNYGCNTPMASQHLMTFRSGAAGYFDLCNDSGTGNFGGLRSGCTNNLVVAGGVLCAPDYTRTCTCSYQNQTSIGLVSMPEAEMWTSFGKLKGSGPLKRMGIIFGAPGDRKAEDGTLWMEYPSVGGASPSVDVKVTGKTLEYFRRHSSRVQGDKPWVVASGLKGVESVTLTLAANTMPMRTYSVRLHFSEPDRLQAGERVFDVMLQGKKVLEHLDVYAEAGGNDRGIVKEFKGVQAAKTLEIAFVPTSKEMKRPLICGIELVAEKEKPSSGGLGDGGR